ncbi:MAG: hypothetical protein NC928_05710 [Candidatus Omnitrophica bacterium]|nr:hypothetical protein [Candidatus Omnitrophota bacterium]
MKTKILICFLWIGLLNSIASASWEKKPQLRLAELCHVDLNDSDDQFYAQHLSATFNYLNKQQEPLFKLMPFFEARRNFKRDIWERVELGLELGTDILPWVYFGQTIQATWLKENYCQYTYHKQREPIEWGTKLMFSYNILERKNLKLRGFILEEYTYDFDLGEGTRNEVAIGLAIPLGNYLETTINWRHIDRIHDFDSDTIEGALTFIF